MPFFRFGIASMRYKKRNQSKRPNHDFYPTPPEISEALLSVESFQGSAWEPACGDGHMSRVIESHGLDCFSSDIRSGTYGEELDFLKANRSVDNIITNPPFKLDDEFAEHSPKCATKKVALMLRLAFLASVKRIPLFQNKDFPLKRVIVLTPRPSLQAGKISNVRGMTDYAWFVWEKGYEGEPIVRPVDIRAFRKKPL